MKMLLFDTSTERGFVTIFQNGTIAFLENLPFGTESSTHLIPTIDEALKKTGLQIKDFDLIGCGVGPGSYTGIRVGAMVAKTFSYAHKIPLVGISSLQTFTPSYEGTFVVLIDAKIGGVYLIKGKKEKEKITYLTTPLIVELEALDPYLKDVKIVVTPNQKRIQPLIEVPDLIWEEKDPNPTHMSQLVLEKYHRHEFSKEGHLDLLYLRKTQAEIEHEEGERKN
jgi:tRNA threonylcarbamoyladenosine biosynthesis protein TsaB